MYILPLKQNQIISLYELIKDNNYDCLIIDTSIYLKKIISGFSKNNDCFYDIELPEKHFVKLYESTINNKNTLIEMGVFDILKKIYNNINEGVSLERL